MIGIQREWVKELIAEYRLVYPQDLREDWLIGEALKEMRKPQNYNKYLKNMMHTAVFAEQLDFEGLQKQRGIV